VTAIEEYVYKVSTRSTIAIYRKLIR